MATAAKRTGAASTSGDASKPATKRAAPARRKASVAAGAARAGEERERRRSTPLLDAVLAETTEPTEVPDLAPHRPRPEVRTGASKKAASLTGTRQPAETPTEDGERPLPRRGRRRPAPRVAQRAPAADTPTPLRRRRSPSEVAAADRAAVAVGRTAGASSAGRLARPTAAGRSPRIAPVPDSPATPTRSGVAALAASAAEEAVGILVSALRASAASIGIAPEDIERRIAEILAYLRRRVEGDYTVDVFGYDEHFTRNVVLPILRPIYTHWFRVEVRGVDNLPLEGPGLVVANHSGTIAIDALMLQLAIHDEHPRHRAMRSLGADLVFQTPFVGSFARRTGSTLATTVDAERLLAAGELVGVFPEGFKGVGKKFTERYKLQRFGRGGFVAAALDAGVPIIPTAIVGAEEVAPILADITPLARLLGLPYFPVTPTFPLLGPLGLIPLPSKWIIEFGEPIATDAYGPGSAEDPMLVFDLTDQVRETIQQSLFDLLTERSSVFR